jgi:hypothetical protein
VISSEVSSKEIISAKTGRRIKIKPEKRFLRLDKPFNDAVRAKKKSAVTNVLLRKELSGELAHRTATKILSTVRRERTLRRETVSESESV